MGWMQGVRPGVFEACVHGLRLAMKDERSGSPAAAGADDKAGAYPAHVKSAAVTNLT